MIKKLFTGIVIAAVVFSVSAQNARVDAMGGCDVIDDITGTIGNPADLNDYPDQIQGTAYSSTTFGPAIGIKSLGDMFRVGAMALPIEDVVFDATAGTYSGTGGSSVLRGHFYSSAQNDVVSRVIGAGNLPTSFITFPHILFGVNLDAITFGLDLFIEATRYNNIIDDDGDKTETSASISNFGTILSANVDIGNISLSPMFGFGIPQTKALYEEEANNVKVEGETNSSILLTLGSEIGFDLGNIDIIGGFFYTLEKYQFKIDTVDTVYELEENKENFLDIYVALTAKVLNNLFLVAQYGLSFGIDKDIDDEAETEDKYTDVYHNFRFGLERPIEGVWIFDELIPRAGLRYSLYDENKYKGQDDANEVGETENSPNEATQVQLTTGIGITKGIAVIDVSIVLGSWDGVLTGPSVIAGTLTLDFGKSSGPPRTTGYDSAPSPVISPEETDLGEPESSTDTDSDFEF